MIREAFLQWQYVDTDSGLILPYYSLPCLQWLKEQNVSEWKVFEYGAGFSTTWWRAHATWVKSIDHSPSWANAMGADCVPQVKSFIEGGKHLPNHIWDCIVVDGDPVTARVDCVEFCRKFIAEGGYLIIDNYDQEGFPAASEYDKFLEGWEKKVFPQPNHTSWKSAVFKKPSA